MPAQCRGCLGRQWLAIDKAKQFFYLPRTEPESFGVQLRELTRDQQSRGVDETAAFAFPGQSSSPGGLHRSSSASCTSAGPPIELVHVVDHEQHQWCRGRVQYIDEGRGGVRLAEVSSEGQRHGTGDVTEKAGARAILRSRRAPCGVPCFSGHQSQESGLSRPWGGDDHDHTRTATHLQRSPETRPDQSRGCRVVHLRIDDPGHRTTPDNGGVVTSRDV